MHVLMTWQHADGHCQRSDVIIPMRISLILSCREVQRCYGQAQGGSTLKEATAVMVCTVEKANIVVNRMVEDNQLSSLCCIVIDEVHMLADAQRGGILESLCTKILFHSGPVPQLQGNGGSPASSAGEGIQVRPG